MAEITAKQVSDLRAKTGGGMMDCKRALVETNGDFDEAVKLLREKGLATAAKKADRIAAEGIVDIAYNDDAKTAVMIEVNAETDFVAKNAEFQSFVKGCLNTILDKRPADVAALSAMAFDGGSTSVDEVLKEKIATIGENITIRRFIIVTGDVSIYVHGKGTIGVIVKGEASNETAAKPEFAEMLKNVALQVAAITPDYLDRGSVPADVLENEKSILMAQIKNDPANEKKPDNIIEKMVSGRISKFFEKVCLMDQGYVKEDNMTVAQYVESVAKQIGDAKVIAYYRYEKGEGIQKREENFAEEIAKLTGN